MDIPDIKFRDKILALLENYYAHSSSGKLMILMQIRSLFKKATISEGLDAIDAIRNEQDFNILLGAGMRGVWYYRLVRRKGELMGV